jgi:hypothetical protein
MTRQAEPPIEQPSRLSRDDKLKGNIEQSQLKFVLQDMIDGSWGYIARGGGDNKLGLLASPPYAKLIQYPDDKGQKAVNLSTLTSSQL